MNAAETDVKLHRFLNMLEPEQLNRLKALVDARTAKRPGPPTNGPETYRGIPVHKGLHHNWDQLEAGWWRLGVDAALTVTVPLVESLHSDTPCSLDHHGYCQEHGLPGAVPCPDGDARKFLAETKEERYAVSDDDLYRVLYTDADGHEQLTDAMTYEQAQSRARDLDGQGFAVGSVMGDVAARGYMHARYAPTYRGVDIPLDLRGNGVPYAAYQAWKRGVDAELDGAAPKPADADPFAPDLTMSRDVADFILRAVNGLLLEGYWPKAYTVNGRHGDRDQDGFDPEVVRKAADLVGRDRIVNRDLRTFIEELDADAEGGES